MGIIDDLKEQADEDISKKLDKDLNVENIQYAFDVLIAPKMKHMYHYFKEFTQHLNTIDKTIKVKNYSKLFPNFGDLSQVEYRVSTDSSGGVVNENEIKELHLRYKYEGQAVKEYIHHTDSRVEADRINKFLSKRKLTFITANNLASMNSGALNFYITKNIPVIFKFVSMPETSKISLNIKNHENFEERTILIDPKDIDNAYLDKLARYILRKDSEFLKIEIDDQVKVQIRQRIEAEKKAKQAEAEKEAELKADQETEEEEKTSFFGKLFNK